MRNFLRKIKEKLRPSRYKWTKKRLIRADLNFYKRIHGYEMDINNPITFTEKIQWYKFFYSKEGLENIVDKYLFKTYIKDKLGEGSTIPLYGYWKSIEELENDWKILPEEFCLKSTISSEGKNIKIIHNKTKVNFPELKKELKNWLKPKNTMLDSYCSAYYKTTPGILAEQYLENIRNQLYDYKFFCFDGEPFCIESAKERFNEEETHFTFYDLEWNKLNVTSGNHPNGDVPYPFHLDDMINLSKILSKGFPHVRVDFFDTKDKLYIAEMTLYTAGGFTKYEPVSFNKTLGDMFILPKV